MQYEGCICHANIDVTCLNPAQQRTNPGRTGRPPGNGQRQFHREYKPECPPGRTKCSPKHHGSRL